MCLLYLRSDDKMLAMIYQRSSKMKKEIPIFFSTDDNYVPFLDVAIASLTANASKEYSYRIIVLNTGLLPENIEKVKRNEQEGLSVNFVDISESIKGISSLFKNIYHFSVATYYRLFIASLFPQYDKIIYLDCDLVVLGDISELYNTELYDNILGAVPDHFVACTKQFRCYAESAVGVDPETYFNAGVLLISLEQFRKHGIEEKFVKLITEYDFDLVDPDQAYLNYLCFGKTRILPNGWNKAPSALSCQGDKNIVHYNLYKKPWQYDDVIDGEYFWHYAKGSSFYEQILCVKSSFGKEEMAKKEAAAKDIVAHAEAIVASENTFAKTIGDKMYGKICS